MPRFQSPISTNSQSSEWTDPSVIPGSNVRLLGPPPHVLPDSQKGAPLTELPQREMLPFRGPPTISKIPRQRTPQVPQWAPTERDTRLQSFLLHLSLKVPVKWAPPPCSAAGSLWREKLHLQSQWFIHSFISVIFPNKETSHEERR